MKTYKKSIHTSLMLFFGILCTTTLSYAHASPKFKTANAEIKQFSLQDQTGKGKFVLDFVGIFDPSFAGEYERYQKLGYPYMPEHEFKQYGAGGMAVFNQSKKLRTFYTTANTVFKAHCTNAPSANSEGQVRMNLKEFSLVLNKNNGTAEEWHAYQEKFKGCYSQNGNLVRLTYQGKHIKSIEFIWMP